jgi:hypothetical protein
VPIERFVNHGISLGLYVYDPEGNRLELYDKTGFKVPQPRIGFESDQAAQHCSPRVVVRL